VPHVTVRGIELNYLERGWGRPVVFLHGVWMSARFFRDQLGPIGERYRAIALDFRGHGLSEKTEQGHTVPEYAADVHAFLEALDLRDVVLLGWSMGAFVLWDYVEQFGTDRLAGTVVVHESASDYPWPGWEHSLIGPELLRDLNAGLQTDRRATIHHFIPLMFTRAPRDEDVSWMAEEMARPPVGAASSILVDQTLRDYREKLAAVTVPSLVVYGADEKLFKIAAGEHLIERLPNARLVVLEDSCHCPFLEAPEQFNAALLEFVDSLA
jgi:pimeloyl-ACP methyl ester carboxylesterase